MTRLSVPDLLQKAGLRPVSFKQIDGHEDNVGEKVLVPLLVAGGYDQLFQIFHKPSLSHAIVGEVRAPDFGVYCYQERPRKLFGLVADVKATDVPLTSHWVEKLAGYCGLAGAVYGVLTNGIDLIVIRPKNGVVEWDYLDDIPNLELLAKTVRNRPTQYPEPHLIYATRITEELTEGTVETLARRCHEIIRSRKGMGVPERLYEFSKLLITRIMDERRFAERKQDSLYLTATSLNELERRSVNIKSHVNELFSSVKSEVGLFREGEGIDLPVDVIKQMVGYLDQYPLWSEEIDVLGQVYEKFLVKTMTGQELGQFFTPRPIVNAIVEMIDPSRTESILDPACGSGGFLISCLLYMKEKYGARTANDVRALANRIRGLDIFETATKLCQINLFLHGDCHDNVVRADATNSEEVPEYVLNALKQPERHGLNCIVTNPPFGAKENNRLDSSWVKTLCDQWQALDVGLFECATTGERYRDLQPQSVFMELCIKMLKKPRTPGGGGRLGIVIDNGLVSNTNKEEPAVRAMIRRECIIEAIVGMPKGTFSAYGSNVIPDFLILRRRHPSEEQGAVFRAEVLNIGLIPGLGSYKEASDKDLTAMVAAWREWRGEETTS